MKQKLQMVLQGEVTMVQGGTPVIDVKRRCGLAALAPVVNFLRSGAPSVQLVLSSSFQEGDGKECVEYFTSELLRLALEDEEFVVEETGDLADKPSTSDLVLIVSRQTKPAEWGNDD